MDYLTGHKASGIKVGDRVRVTRTAGQGENGWENTWIKEDMNQSVGNVFTIQADSDDRGFTLSDKFNLMYPYFCLELLGQDNDDVGSIPTDTIIQKLHTMFPNGHDQFIPITLDEIKLHSQKNYDYAHGGRATGNFDRVAKILAMYPGLKMSQPQNVAIVYLLKQLDAALWMESQGHEAVVEGTDDRWRDISVYAKLVRILIKEGL
jgi:hypothetical protein